MLHAITSMVLCAVCWSAAFGWFADDQSPDQIVEVNFRVRGIGLGSSRALVLRQLGRPVSTKLEKNVDKEETCGPPYNLLTLSYEGAVVEFMGDLRSRNFEVISMEVTSPRLLIAPGIRIGMTEKEIRSKLGEPWRVLNESGFQILNYVTKGNDGGAGLYFLKGRLVKVQWQYTLC